MFLVLKLPRTGSSMFGKVLSSHPEIICDNELLNHLAQESLERKIAYLSQYFSEKTLEDKNTSKSKIIGGTINPFKYQLAPHDLRSITYPESQSRIGFWFAKDIKREKPKVEIILLLRKNILKQAISLYMIEQGEAFYSSKTHIQDKALLQTLSQRQWFDFDKLQKKANYCQDLSKKLTRFTQSITNDYLPIFYEDINQNPEETFKKVFDYIGVSNVRQDFDFTGGFKKILSDDVRDIISNFDDIYQYPLLRTYL